MIQVNLCIQSRIQYLLVVYYILSRALPNKDLYVVVKMTLHFGTHSIGIEL